MTTLVKPVTLNGSMILISLTGQSKLQDGLVIGTKLLGNIITLTSKDSNGD